jgi:peptidoglycan hydrolase CwlO-like protein
MVNPRRFPVAGRAIAVMLALILGALLLPGGALAGPPTPQEVQRAKDRAAALAADVKHARDQLAQISQNVGAVTEQVLQAQDQLTAIQNELTKTREKLAVTQAHFDEVMGRLNQRARTSYMQGVGSGLDFILGATSLTDLSDRVTFLDAVQQSDADLATEVENVANQLDTQVQAQEKLQEKQAAVLLNLKTKKAELQAAQDQQQTIVDQIAAKQEEARKLAAKLSKQRAAWLKSQLGVSTGNGLFQVCPVDQPRSFGDGFGAPRSAGGFHLHMGVDIVAPLGTPIRAPFDGVARASSNTLGGSAVYVTGSTGYVYNAHLSAYSANSNGPVQAGEIIGYVGWSGDAYGGIYHDHFEYHPNVIPANWPASAYGYSVIDGAINPYPLLVEACF